jgi:hypothetical protein
MDDDLPFWLQTKLINTFNAHTHPFWVTGRERRAGAALMSELNAHHWPNYWTAE